MDESHEKDAFHSTGEASPYYPDSRPEHGKQSLSTSTFVPQAKPINNTWWRRNLTLFGMRATRRLIRRRGGNVIRLLGDRVCVKKSHFLTLADAATLQFVAQHTSIPVPKVYCAFERKGDVYIAMEHIKGDLAGSGWSSRSESARQKIVMQLRQMMAELRSIPHPEHIGIANVTGGAFFDDRLPGTVSRHGPFKTVADFHRHLREGWDEAHHPRYPEIDQLVEQHKGTWPICFTHGDLHSMNVLVRGDEVVGIIDWDTAGWYPSYWEYTTACATAPINQLWPGVVDQFLEPMPKELAMEELRDRYFSWMGVHPSVKIP
ncbi:MAG: hypothetical protein L6R38_009719 [Xanthoria sp. 2 TBL-2021]|nr:MAG: hypothetical protein L6R38_009719 [Xanthoria sp. 2 TBL-2021]